MEIAGETGCAVSPAAIRITSVAGLESVKVESSMESLSDEPDFSFLNLTCPDHYGANLFCARCTHALGLTVIDVEKGVANLRLLCTDNKEVILKDQWLFTEVKAGDHIRVLVPSYKSHRSNIEVTSTEGAVIVAPEIILSASKLLSSIYCRRRFLLDSMFHFGETSGKAVLVGDIAHKIFQTAVKQRICNLDALTDVAKEILRDVDSMKMLYFFDLPVAEVWEDLKTPVNSSCSFVRKYVINGEPILNSEFREPVLFDSVADIEDELICQRLALRGNTDLTLRLKRRNGLARVPLELKSNRSVCSNEHNAQVKLYNILLSSQYQELCDRGLLYYLGDEKMKSVGLSANDACGLLQLRNEVASFLRLFFDASEEISLPGVVSNPRMCQKCPQRMACSILPRSNDYPAMQTFAADNVQHLSASELDYCNKWLLWLCLECTERCQKLADSENEGSCTDSSTGMYFAVRSISSNGQLLAIQLAYNKKLDIAHTFLVFDQVIVTSAKDEVTTSICTVREISENSMVVHTHRSLKFSTGDIVAVRKYVGNLKFDPSMKSVMQLMQNTSISEVGMYFIRHEVHYMLFTLYPYEVGGKPLAYLTVVRELKKHGNCFRKRIRELIIDLAEPTAMTKLNSSLFVGTKDIFSELNVEQAQAIFKAVAANDYALIKGYPGSGKTSTIVALIRLLLHWEKSVLIASHTNCAVDNVLVKLMQYTNDILRIGIPESIDASTQRFLPEARLGRAPSFDLVVNVFDKTAVVGATCHTISSHPLFVRRKFDVCIIDEATLVLESFCLPALLCSQKFILVGDSLQLQPLVLSPKARKEGMATSLFAKLESRYPSAVCKLQRQYRMNRVICSLSSTMFYEGHLKPGNPRVENAVLEHTSSCSPDEHWLKSCLSLNMDDSVIFVSTSRCTHASAFRKSASAVENLFEATLVTRLCDMFFKVGLCAEQIGVLTTYRHQVDVVKRCLLQSQLHNENSIQVNTIDQFQGKDKEVIIISFVWTSNLKTRDDSPCPFLEDEKRLNVALTRAKKKLIMIGHLTDLAENMPVFSLLRKQLLDNQIVWMDESTS